MGESLVFRASRGQPLSGRALGITVAAILSGSCGNTSLVIGGDPERQAFAEAGTTGASAGHAGTGGLAGSSGSGGGGTGGDLMLPGGGNMAGNPDAYPAVHWENEQADATLCADAGVNGITCVHVAEATSACVPGGDPSCNGCSCVVPCGASEDCPIGSNGAAGTCVPTDAGTASCFLGCDDGRCPLGMVCVPHPNGGAAVCVWSAPDAPHETPR